MKIRFMAGEMAGLHNISKQTLIYYDRIGLFQPEETDKETGYRYYALEQCEDLDVIICLKNLGMPLKEIKDYLQHTTTAERICLLENRESMMRDKIEEIKRVRNRLQNIISSLKNRVNICPFEMGIKRYRKRFIVSDHVAPPFDEYQLEVAIKKLFQNIRERDDTGIHELLVYVETSSLSNALFKMVALQVESDTGQTIAAGDYAYIYHKGTIQALNDSRQKLVDYVEASCYRASTTTTIEKILLDALAVSNHDDYLVEVQIPVVKRTR